MALPYKKLYGDIYNNYYKKIRANIGKRHREDAQVRKRSKLKNTKSIAYSVAGKFKSPSSKKSSQKKYKYSKKGKSSAKKSVKKTTVKKVTAKSINKKTKKNTKTKAKTVDKKKSTGTATDKPIVKVTQTSQEYGGETTTTYKNTLNEGYVSKGYWKYI